MVNSFRHTRNTTTRWPVRALAMRLAGNAQGGFYFFSLDSGRIRIINRLHATRMPMPNEVISHQGDGLECSLTQIVFLPLPS